LKKQEKEKSTKSNLRIEELEKEKGQLSEKNSALEKEIETLKSLHEKEKKNLQEQISKQQLALDEAQEKLRSEPNIEQPNLEPLTPPKEEETDGEIENLKDQIQQVTSKSFNVEPQKRKEKKRKLSETQQTSNKIKIYTQKRFKQSEFSFLTLLFPPSFPPSLSA